MSEMTMQEVVEMLRRHGERARMYDCMTASRELDSCALAVEARELRVGELESAARQVCRCLFDRHVEEHELSEYADMLRSALSTPAEKETTMTDEQVKREVNVLMQRWFPDDAAYKRFAVGVIKRAEKIMAEEVASSSHPSPPQGGCPNCEKPMNTGGRQIFGCHCDKPDGHASPPQEVWRNVGECDLHVESGVFSPTPASNVSAAEPDGEEDWWKEDIKSDSWVFHCHKDIMASDGDPWKVGRIISQHAAKRYRDRCNAELARRTEALQKRIESMQAASKECMADTDALLMCDWHSQEKGEAGTPCGTCKACLHDRCEALKADVKELVGWVKETKSNFGGHRDFIELGLDERADALIAKHKGNGNADQRD